MLLPQLVTTVLNLGLGYANVYFLNRKELSFDTALRFTVKASSIICGIGTLVATVVVWKFGSVLFPGVPSQLLYIAAIGVIPQLMILHLSSLLQASHDFRRYNQILLATPVFTLLLTILHVWILKQGVLGAVLGFLEGALVGLGVTFLHIRNVRAGRPEVLSNDSVASTDTVELGLARRMIFYGWSVHLSNVLTFANTRVDLFLVNVLMAPAAAGTYVVAINIGERLWMLSQASGTVLLPRLANIDLPEQERKKITAVVAAGMLWIAAGGSLILAMLAKPLIGFVFGQQYLESAEILIWLLPGMVIGSQARVIANDFVARNRTDLNLYSAVGIIAINVVCNIILTPKLGSKGAALATSIAYCTDGLIKTILYAKVSGNQWWSSLILDRSARQALARVIYMRKP